jgi:hypothetical protein
LRHRARPWVSLLVAACCCHAGAQTRIYSCVDARGHRLTADRPIMECLDREQQQYGENGLVRGKLPPSMTGEERAAEEEKTRREQQALQHQAELKRRDRVLLNRYPDASSHDRERAASLAQVDGAIAAGELRTAELQKQRAALEQQARSPTRDIAKANGLKRALDQNAELQAELNRILTSQREERQRISVRFDEERVRLQTLWAASQSQPRAVPTTAVTATAAAPARPFASRAR